MSSAILYLAIVGIWAVVLVPRWLRPSQASGTLESHLSEPLDASMQEDLAEEDVAEEDLAEENTEDGLPGPLGPPGLRRPVRLPGPPARPAPPRAPAQGRWGRRTPTAGVNLRSAPGDDSGRTTGPGRWRPNAGQASCGPAG